MAATAGASIGGLVGAGGIILSDVDSRITIACLVGGVIILAVSYLFFRHGSERSEGSFKDKKGSAKQTIQQIQQLSSQLKVG
jgi:hypothetical protein